MVLNKNVGPGKNPTLINVGPTFIPTTLIKVTISFKSFLVALQLCTNVSLFLVQYLLISSFIGMYVVQ